ncbi:ribonuclease R [Dinoroseobacter shibae DFL 12 = DSM 16493]|jgi:ribonuclease R|uniref:Ribonuclease R n=1 Tax=Dinoroseobacter shibae (strain DSM 16493 / NCIMB 14021 / DFL 12) TaxID=398580 RepID=A8LJT8_DINSH|nr:ribonuclease R [Dinoroseobacter shibae]ABV91764.1 ribonuclease R [Dinoroseobacter shibae DFL 12 = DSM 16493]URF46746.1 ribonuclease R [Dinoroseobacter shibae]URF51057.1 ribonuclease R [Dinoroseobacter shibae]
MDRFPTKDEVLAWIEDNPARANKREIARAFGIKGAARIDLKRLLKELEGKGHLEKRKRSYRDPESLPPVSVLKVGDADGDGDLFARPLDWQGAGAEPACLIIPRKGDPALAEGDRILARLTRVEGEDYAYEARLIRRIGTGPRKILGILRKTAEGGRIVPIDKGADREWRVAQGGLLGAQDGDLVEAEQAGPKGRMGLPLARVTQVLGDPGGAKSVSLIAIHQHGILDEFPEAALAEAEAVTAPELGARTDLRDLPLITIDPPDARDRDDAVCAIPDDDPANPGGFVLWVAIADVAAAVRPGGALDREARKRGNSTYFPDRVVPMLPDSLSGDLCSLHEDVDRACMAVRMVIDAEGTKRGQTFHRGLMRSRASLAYGEVQAAVDGDPTERTEPLLEPILRPLFAAYEALKAARARRQPLDLDLPERRIALSETGEVTSVAFRDRLEVHRLIEEFMVLANVAAAETLAKKRTPLLYRVHEEPAETKLDALRETVQAAGLTLAKGRVLRTADLNRLLAQAAGTDDAELINISTLRSMTQAYYSPENFGHFGLALQNYAHFTSPIRRYADLIVHRALITAHGFGEDGLSEADIERLDETGKLISEAERRSMAAERDTIDRYLAAYLADRVGNEFSARISGVARFGAFARLDETGADGLIPIRTIGAEFFHFDADAQALVGSDTGFRLAMGQRVTVRLAEAVPVTGGIGLELLAVEDETVPTGRRRGKSRPVRRKIAAKKAKAGKLKKKLKRKRV